MTNTRNTLATPFPPCAPRLAAPPLAGRCPHRRRERPPKGGRGRRLRPPRWRARMRPLRARRRRGASRRGLRGRRAWGREARNGGGSAHGARRARAAHNSRAWRVRRSRVCHSGGSMATRRAAFGAWCRRAAGGKRARVAPGCARARRGRPRVRGLLRVTHTRAAPKLLPSKPSPSFHNRGRREKRLHRTHDERHGRSSGTCGHGSGRKGGAARNVTRGFVARSPAFLSSDRLRPGDGPLHQLTGSHCGWRGRLDRRTWPCLLRSLWADCARAGDSCRRCQGTRGHPRGGKGFGSALPLPPPTLPIGAGRCPLPAKVMNSRNRASTDCTSTAST